MTTYRIVFLHHTEYVNSLFVNNPDCVVKCDITIQIPAKIINVGTPLNSTYPIDHVVTGEACEAIDGQPLRDIDLYQTKLVITGFEKVSRYDRFDFKPLFVDCYAVLTLYLSSHTKIDFKAPIELQESNQQR